jgi:hypothetical protein
MAHKHKVKPSEIKTTQKSKDAAKTKTAAHKPKESAKNQIVPETEATKGNKTQVKNVSQPAIRVVSKPEVKAPTPHSNVQPSKSTDTKPQFTIVHKHKRVRKNTNIIGAHALAAWKKSSGRGKSWALCQRVKISRDDLELMLQSKNSPISLGWLFSSSTIPGTFVRSQGLRVYEKGETKKKGVSRVRTKRDPDQECDAKLELSTPLSLKGKKIHHLGGCSNAGEVSFLRLTVDHGAASITHEFFLEEITLSTTQPPPTDGKEHSSGTILEDLVVIKLLKNESHADVYLVRNLDHPSKYYHAHVFLPDISGKWSAFSKRKMDRLRKSPGFYADTVQLGRKVIVMDEEPKAEKEFCIKKMLKEFPQLPGTGENSF